jgi:hypothetical protein
MDRLKKLLDGNLAALCEQERYFTASFIAARQLLDGAQIGNGGILFPSGSLAGPRGCSCGDRGCLHAIAWRIFTYEG